MKKTILCLCLALFIGAGLMGSPAPAADITLFDWAFYVNGTTYEFTLGDSMPTSGSLNSQGLGTLTWTGGSGGANTFIAFFDHEIDEDVNTYFNEKGDAVGTPAAGQSWQIDEPGWGNPETSYVGTIYDNVLAGTLGNSNVGGPEDISMALGWNFSLNPGETAFITLVLSDTAPSSGFYLWQSDPDGGNIYFSSSLDIQTGVVPLPGAVYLLGSGLALLWWRGRRKS